MSPMTHDPFLSTACTDDIQICIDHLSLRYCTASPRLKCQHNGSPCCFLVLVPLNDGGNCGVFLIFKFFLSGFSITSTSECCLSVSATRFVPLGSGTKCTFMRGSCMSLRNAPSRGGASVGLPLMSPLCSAARVEKCSLSALVQCTKMLRGH